MSNGISVYLGLDNTLEENIYLINIANKCGIKRIFTSLHIPETDINLLQQQIHTVLNLTKQYDMEVISDISPNTLNVLGMKKLNLDELYNLGIKVIRLDFGYNIKDIVEFNKTKMKLQFNASTITKEFLEKLFLYNIDFSQIEALHNFYPRENTGLSINKFIEQTKLLHDYGIKVSGFVPSYNKARLPLKKGLPTLEYHRYKDVNFSAKHLKLLGVDSIFIGDSLPTKKELKALNDTVNDYLTLRIKIFTKNKFVQDLLQNNIFTIRQDESDSVIRLQESRFLCKNQIILSEYLTPREIGYITLDNLEYGRYMGEMQVITKKQCLDNKVNVVAKVQKEDIALLAYLKGNSKCKFVIE